MINWELICISRRELQRRVSSSEEQLDSNVLHRSCLSFNVPSPLNCPPLPSHGAGKLGEWTKAGVEDDGFIKRKDPLFNNSRKSNSSKPYHSSSQTGKFKPLPYLSQLSLNEWRHTHGLCMVKLILGCLSRAPWRKCLINRLCRSLSWVQSRCL